MKISYLMNSYVFMEMYSSVENTNIKIEEVKIGSILKYLKNEEKEKVYENIKSLVSLIENVQIEKTINKDIFKSVFVKQVGTYPIEAFNIDICEDLGLSIDVIERIKSAIFICCSNISLIINKNSSDIEDGIEEVMIDIKKFYYDEASNENKVLDIMIRNDESVMDDFILSVDFNDCVSDDLVNETIYGEVSFRVIDMLSEFSDYMNNDVVSLLVEDECIIRIVKVDGVVGFEYNKAIINELPEDIESSLRTKSKELLEIITN